MKKRKITLLSGLFKKIGKRLGISVFIEKEWGVVGQLVYPNGIVRYFRGTTVDINTMGASAIAQDKDYAKIFLKNFGFPVAPWKKFYSDAWAKAIGSDKTISKAWEYAKNRLPVFVKPNSKSQGRGVIKAFNKTEFFRAFKENARIDNVILVEQPVLGKNYRLVVLDDEVISAYERIPLSVVGDDTSSVSSLLGKKQKLFKKAGRDKTFKVNDLRILASLKRAGLSMNSVLPKNQNVVLLYNANLSTGGTSIDVTDLAHTFYKQIAILITKKMGLRLCGVDIVINGDISKPFSEWYVLEINSAPGLDHYASMGKNRKKLLKIYTQKF